MEGSANMFIGPEPILDTFLQLRGFVALFLATTL